MKLFALDIPTGEFRRSKPATRRRKRKRAGERPTKRLRRYIGQSAARRLARGT